MMADQKTVLRLLKTARGQMDGIIKMVEEDRYCIDISTQVMATEAILKRCNREILAAHLEHCVKNAVTGANETPMETIAASQPDYLYILVGTNNLVVQGSEDSFIAYYERLIDMLREQLNPGVTIYIQSIPGVQEDVVASKPGLDNTRIATVNDLLANMALRKGCYYINIREALTNPADGSQIDDYATKDGVHFNAAGYHAWAEYLATHTVWNRRSVYSGENPYYIYGT